MHEIERLIKERDTVKVIVKTVCMALKVKEKDFQTKSRERHLMDARSMIYACCNDILDIGCSAISRYFKMNHATIIHHLKKHKSLIDFDSVYAERYEAIVMLIKSKIGYNEDSEIIDELIRIKKERALKLEMIKEHLNN